MGFDSRKWRPSHPRIDVVYCAAILFVGLFHGSPVAGQPAGKLALQRADTAYRAGYAAMQAGKLEIARQDFAQAVSFAPQLPEARVALGAVLVQLGRAAEAIPELEKADRLKPGDVAIETSLAIAHETLARTLAAAGNRIDAQTKLETAIALLPASREATLGATWQDELGSLLAQQKQWPAAEAAFRKALALRPFGDEAPAVHMHLGIVLVEEKQFPAGLEELTKAAHGAPGNSQAQLQLGRGLAAAGQDEEALPPLQEALRLTANLPGGALELAMALQRLGKQQESIPLFERAVAQEPNNAQALTNLGLALTETGKASDAVPYFNRALAETPNDPVVHEDLGVAELQQSHFDAAIAQFEQARALDSNNPQLHYDLGLAYKFKDRMDDAIRELTAAAQLDPALPDPPYTLGILYMQLGKLELAAAQLSRAIELRPSNGDGWAILGAVYKQLDRRDQAEAALRKAIELLPEQPGPHITLAGVLAEDGKKEEAAAERKLAAGLSRTAVNHQRAVFSANAGNQAMQRGEIADAVSRYQEAIAADPNFAEAHAQLALAYARQGRGDEAAAERAQAEALAQKE